jgi:hypothetical protein
MIRNLWKRVRAFFGVVEQVVSRTEEDVISNTVGGGIYPGRVYRVDGSSFVPRDMDIRARPDADAYDIYFPSGGRLSISGNEFRSLYSTSNGMGEFVGRLSMYVATQERTERNMAPEVVPSVRKKIKRNLPDWF